MKTSAVVHRSCEYQLESLLLLVVRRRRRTRITKFPNKIAQAKVHSYYGGGSVIDNERNCRTRTEYLKLLTVHVWYSPFSFGAI